MNNNLPTFSRRELIKHFGLGAVALSGLFGASHQAFAKNAQHVLVVGGGIGGATFAKYLRFADSDVKITVIEPNKEYITCLRTNDVMVDLHTLDELTFSYDTLRNQYGIQFLFDSVTDVDFDKKQVRTAKGEKISYDKLVLSPGIDFRFEDHEGLDAEVAASQVPHAYKAGPQTLLLRDQVQSMPQGGTFVLSPPAGEFRCPPGPYERASMFAEWMQKHNPTGKVLILDPKNNHSKFGPFRKGWERLYGFGSDNSMIEWVSLDEGGKVIAVDPKRKVVKTDHGTEIKYDACNLIPNQRAGKIAQHLGLTDQSGWCPIQRNTFESEIQKNVYVLGDSSIADAMPKSGNAANTQAKVAAKAIAAELKGETPGNAIFSNVCFSLVGSRYGISISAIYEVRDGLIKPKGKSAGVSPIIDSPAQASLEAVYQKNWHRTFVKDVFG
ncbi:FAD-dependent oxidoreductase [Thiomicrospira microaerophila]|uniref:NAD(P)/FAD-dependent oxidoreductase n=1 Tax=Thiomicrospira microaerophila TaxID=406020 RepID=UPI00200BF4B4|nr:NAD(P)/FAD-dependent oxidoreductase [Thiomicrospira microaerophila]UQB41602.1 FAD-dependent oxidoreductase [Thiomicrospira microaerophila]